MQLFGKLRQFKTLLFRNNGNAASDPFSELWYLFIQENELTH